MILGKNFENLLHDSLHFGSITDSSECFLYSVPEPLRSASLERHLQSAWYRRHVSTHELGPALWFQPRQAVQERISLQSHHCWLTCLEKLFSPYRNALSPVSPRLWCKSSLYEPVGSGIELRPKGRSNVSKLTDLLLTATSNICHVLQ